MRNVTSRLTGYPRARWPGLRALPPSGWNVLRRLEKPIERPRNCEQPRRHSECLALVSKECPFRAELLCDTRFFLRLQPRVSIRIPSRLIHPACRRKIAQIATTLGHQPSCAMRYINFNEHEQEEARFFGLTKPNAPTIELGVIYGPRLQQGLSKVPFSGHPDGERLQFRLVKLHVPSSCCTLAITGVNKFLIL